MASTGLRLSEATGLWRADVDLKIGLLLIRQAKFGKSRWVPVLPSVSNALQRYAQRRDRDPQSANTKAFFVFDDGRAVSAHSLQYAFQQLRKQLQWRSRGGYPELRVHDL